MPYVNYEAFTVSATTDSSGGSGYSANAYNGCLQAIQYVENETSTEALSLTHGMAITAEKTSQELLSITCTGAQIWYPRAIGISSTGAALSSGVDIAFPLHNERILVTLTSGATGGERSGTYRVWVS